ncbi:hypothetical protein BDC45DRAFT_499326 [Circinella umbellata]|nr:hypothetical protein BDC45DRAFT_499326 [Circinella umbellata]
MRSRLSNAYPPWHPIIHHSLVLCFLLMMVLLPVLYIRTRQPPYWVLLVVLCSFVVIYISYWIWLCCRPQQHHELEDKSIDDTITIPDVSVYNPSTVGIPPSSYMVDHRPSSSSPSTLPLSHHSSLQQPQQQLIQSQQRQQNLSTTPNSSTIQRQSMRYSTLSTGSATDQPAPPPAYHLSFSHIAVELPQNGSPPSYHSAKDDEDDNNINNNYNGTIGSSSSRRNQHHYHPY